MLRAAASRAAGPYSAASSAAGRALGLRPFSRINYDTGADDVDALFNETLVRCSSRWMPPVLRSGSTCRRHAPTHGLYQRSLLTYSDNN